MWDASTGEVKRTLTGHKGTVYTVAFTPAGLATASADKTAKVWDMETGEAVRTLPEHKGEVMAVAATTDGSRWATAGKDRVVRVSVGGTRTSRR